MSGKAAEAARLPFAMQPLSGALGKAAHAFLHSDEQSAEALARQAYAESTEEEEREAAASLLFALLVWQGRFAELSEFGLPREEEEADTIKLYENQEIRLYEGVATQPMPVILGNHPSTTVLVNGQEVTMLLDTGAMITTLSRSTALRCGVAVEEAEVQGETPMGAIAANPAVIGNLTLGILEASEKNCIVLPDEALDFTAYPGGGQVDGVLGWEVLREARWILDYEEETLTVERSVPMEGERNMSCDFFPLVRLMLGERELVMGLDTGADISFFGESAREFLQVRESQSEKIGTAGGVGEQEFAKLPPLTLRIAGRDIRLRQARLTSDREYSYAQFFTLPGVLGGDIALKSKLVLDYPNRHLRIV